MPKETFYQAQAIQPLLDHDLFSTGWDYWVRFNLSYGLLAVIRGVVPKFAVIALKVPNDCFREADVQNVVVGAS